MEEVTSDVAQRRGGGGGTSASENARSSSVGFDSARLGSACSVNASIS